MKEELFVDTSAKYHMVYNTSLLTDITSIVSIRQVRVGNGDLLRVAATGTLQLGPMRFEGVLVVPDLTVNLLSVSKTPVTHGWYINSQSATCSDADGLPVLHAPRVNGLYIIQASRIRARIAEASPADPIAELRLSHEKLGHLKGW